MKHSQHIKNKHSNNKTRKHKSLKTYKGDTIIMFTPLKI